MSRGIYLVANRNSEDQCANLIYSIRNSGCQLPIRLIPFGGEPVYNSYVLQNVERVDISGFPAQAHQLISEIADVLTDCPRGFLNRFLSFFGDWEEYIYSDNDVVAFMNWEELFGFLPGYDLVHADEEYTTEGCFSYDQPNKLKEIFGPTATLSAFTAGHFVSRANGEMVGALRRAVTWFRENPSIAKRHDQALLHIASLLANWRILNLCRPPHNWLSPWAGDYQNSLAVIQKIQAGSRISHFHYSGWQPRLTKANEEFLLASAADGPRLRQLFTAGLSELTGINTLRRARPGLRRRLF